MIETAFFKILFQPDSIILRNSRRYGPGHHLFELILISVIEILEKLEQAISEVIDVAVNPDHVHLFIIYPPKYSVSYISKMIKARSSRVLRKEFPHLKEWCGDHLWAPSCYHDSVGAGWDVVEKYISAQNTYEHNRR
jgi:putative transposase